MPAAVPTGDPNLILFCGHAHPAEKNHAVPNTIVVHSVVRPRGRPRVHRIRPHGSERYHRRLHVAIVPTGRCLRIESSYLRPIPTFHSSASQWLALRT